MDQYKLVSKKLDVLSDCIHKDIYKVSIRLSLVEESLGSLQQHFSQPFLNEMVETLGIQQLSNNVKNISERLSMVEGRLIPPQDKSPLSLRSVVKKLSMPGMKFIGAKQQNKFHTYVWMIIHVTVLLIGSYYIQKEYDNWQSSPVIKTLSNNLTYVNEIPFPAITICIPYTLVDDYDYAESLKKCLVCVNKTYESCSFSDVCNSEDKVKLAIASTFCDLFANSGIVPEPPSNVYTNQSIDGDQFWIHAAKIFPPCDAEIYQEKFKTSERIVGCDEGGYQHFLVGNGIFGMCTTINGLQHEDIYRETTVTPLPVKRKPSDPKYKGAGLTLENMLYYTGSNDTIPLYNNIDDVIIYFVTKRSNKKNINVCNSLFTTKIASVKLHNPAEIPILQDLEYTIQEEEMNLMSVTPKLITTEKELTNYPPNKRGCFYSNERKLLLFKHYSQNNCEVECAVNCSLQKCGCVPNYLPRQNISTRVCIKFCDTLCDCGCLPDCIALTYEYETSKEPKKPDGMGFIRISYKSKGFYPTIRASMKDFAEFIAYSLGILGVFNGFSIMVLFEVAYLLILQLWPSVKIYIGLV